MTKIKRSILDKRSNKEKILQFFGKGGIDEAKVKELSHDWRKWSAKYA